MITVPSQVDEMYQALTRRDVSYEGIFYTCVKTTGIFCRPTCSARTPKKGNVEFAETAKEALGLGYRPCKVCSPLKMSGATPDWIVDLLKQVEKDPQVKLKDYDLKEQGLHPNRVRRWFLKNHGMTFQAYQRSIRISTAFGNIKYGDNKVAHVAFDSGYDSLSGFTDAFKKTTGFSPKESVKGKIIYITRLITPLGPMLAAAVDEGICLLEFVDRKMLETELKQLAKLLNSKYIIGKHRHFDQLHEELMGYFDGNRMSFEVPLVTPGTQFQNQVWQVLQQIPYGETRSYQQQAKKLGNPKAVRAVANANGYNRIAIVIPCHRVIGSDGNLVGYGGGLQRKKYLLQLEGKFANSDHTNTSLQLSVFQHKK